jgi:dolichyl-phosphate-mannose-protein mannosyltransferase
MQEPEPSVLDYLKSRLPWSRRRIEVPTAAELPPASSTEAASTGEAASPMPWRSVLALAFALFAQVFLEPANPSAPLGIAFYALAVALLLWTVLRGEWTLAPHRASAAGNDPLTVRWLPFVISVLLFVPAFVFLGGSQIAPGLEVPSALVSLFGLQDNLFTWYNLALWLAAAALFIASLWLRRSGVTPASKRRWQLTIDRGTLLLLALTVIVVFFRVYHLQQTPAEPFSDHAEKILDVYDVSQGKTHIFFPRNTGREAIQMYWTLLVSWVFRTGLTFLSLKIGTILIGLFTLPFMYLLGKEVAGERVGLLALFLTGIGYWPNVISRIGLRFPLYPMFVAPMLLYLIRGLRTRHRNDFILSGIFLGLGLHGYSPFRIVPLLVIVAFILYALHAQSRGGRQDALLWLVILGLTSLFIFLPLLRYATANPEMFSYRALTRLGSIEQPLHAPWPVVFMSNTWNALRMFNWDDGVIWVHSIPDRPALDIVTGALFLFGAVLLVVRYLRQRHWLDIFLLVSIPILLLPSILSLAFPDENPSLNRTAGALVPVFLIAAMALDGFIRALMLQSRRRVWAYGLTGLLLIWSASQNFDLVFHQFDQNFRNNAWNTSDMGELIKQFRAVNGETDTVWIVPFPYWVDTRLPGIYAGIPNRDFAMWSDQLPGTVKVAGPKLFIVKANADDPSQNDQKSLDLLQQLYPQGALELHHSPIPGHDFWLFSVPVASSP